MAACRLFSRVQSQWVRDNGYLTSLDYQGVETVARIMKVDLDDELFRCIQIMENEVMKESAERARRARG